MAPVSYTHLDVYKRQDLFSYNQITSTTEETVNHLLNQINPKRKEVNGSFEYFAVTLDYLDKS